MTGTKKNQSLKNIKESLIQQVEKKGSKTPFFLALIDDYVKYEKQEREFNKDVKKRGYVFTATSAQGKTYDKENPSIKAAIMCNKQKLAILNQLGISIDKVETGEDDFDSEL